MSLGRMVTENPRKGRLISAIRLYGLLIAVTVVMALLLQTPASAALLRCASHHLAPAERNEVFDRALHVVPRGSGSLTLESACWNRDFAIAWFRTPTAVDPDGVRWWWSVRCDRRTRPWSCSPAKRERRIEVSVADGARLATIVGSFPEGMSASRAKAIVAAVATLATKPEMPLAACSGGSGDAHKWLPVRWNPPAPDLNYPAAEVDVTSTGAIVDYASSIRFRFDNDDRAVCWDELVIVD
jgi:hypothetical protein